MYIGLSEEQKKLRHELRAYYERLLTPAVREDLASEHGIGPKTRAIRQQMAKDGWLCFGWPKEYGGQGRDAVDHFIFFDESMRASAPVPMLTVNTVGPTLMRYGSEEQKRFFLPRMASGEIEFCIGYSDEQQAAIELARQILGDQCTPQKLRALEQADGPRFDRALWKQLAEAGLIAAGLPEAQGGAGLGFLVVAGIVEQLGRTVAPVPLLETSVLGALPLAAFGSPAQKEAWLPRATRGEAILTAALVEPHREPSAPDTRAVRDGQAFRVSGRKLCVPAGPIADLILVPAALTGEGLGVFLVESRAAGVQQTALRTTSLQPESLLELDGAHGERLGGLEQGAEIVAWIELRATAALCALAVGVCSEALRLTAEYTKTRKQFDQPIATFQAVAQRAADAFIDSEAVRLTALQAAWRIDAGLPAEAAVAAAKYWAALGGSRVVRAAQHLHGGVGVDREYALHRYYVYARQLELTLGGATQQLRRLGRLIASEVA